MEPGSSRWKWIAAGGCATVAAAAGVGAWWASRRSRGEGGITRNDFNNDEGFDRRTLSCGGLQRSPSFDETDLNRDGVIDRDEFGQVFENTLRISTTKRITKTSHKAKKVSLSSGPYQWLLSRGPYPWPLSRGPYPLPLSCSPCPLLLSRGPYL